jgi:ribosomal protein L21E
MRRGERVRVKLPAKLPAKLPGKVDKSFQGRTGTVNADSAPDEVVLVSLDGEAVLQQFLTEDLERIG